MTKWGILVPAALVTLFFMASCQQPNLSGYALKTSPAGKCLDCHSADASGAQGGLTGAPLANQVTYALAGHSQGLRKVSPSGGYSAPSPAIEASAGCTKCHASQGFINWVTFGPVPVALSGTTSADAMINASITMSTADATSILNSCFLCHDLNTLWAYVLLI